MGIQQCMGIACNRAFNSGVKNILPDPDLRKKLGSGSRYLLVCTENLVVRNLSEQSCLYGIENFHLNVFKKLKNLFKRF